MVFSIVALVVLVGVVFLAGYCLYTSERTNERRGLEQWRQWEYPIENMDRHHERERYWHTY